MEDSIDKIKFKDIGITAAIGYSVINESQSDYKTAFNIAESAMYKVYTRKPFRSKKAVL